MSTDIKQVTSQLKRQNFFEEGSGSDSDSAIHLPRNPHSKRKSLHEMMTFNSTLKEQMSELIKSCNRSIGGIEGEKPSGISKKELFIARVKRYVDTKVSQLNLDAENRKGSKLLAQLRHISKRLSGTKVDSIYKNGRMFVPWSVIWKNRRLIPVNSNPYAYLDEERTQPHPQHQ